MALWLARMRSTSERAVRVRALAGEIVFCSWVRHFTLTVPLSTRVYKWVPANCWGNLTNCGEVTCSELASRPGEVEILLAASCYRNRGKHRQLWASLGSKASLTLPISKKLVAYFFLPPASSTCSQPRQDLFVFFLYPSHEKYYLNSQNFQPFYNCKSSGKMFVILTSSMHLSSNYNQSSCQNNSTCHITIIPWARVGYNHFISNKGELNNCFSKFSNRFCRRFLFSQFYKASGKSIQLRAPTPAITWLLHNQKLNESDSYANDNLSSTCGENQARII